MLTQMPTVGRPAPQVGKQEASDSGNKRKGSPGTCCGASSVGSCRLMKRRRPAAPNSRTDENMQASRIVPGRRVIQGTLRGHLLGVGGTFFPHRPYQASIRLRSTGRGGERISSELQDIEAPVTAVTRCNQIPGSTPGTEVCPLHLFKLKEAEEVLLPPVVRTLAPTRVS